MVTVELEKVGFGSSLPMTDAKDTKALEREIETLRRRVAELQRRAARYDETNQTERRAGVDISTSEREELLSEVERIAHMGSWVWNLENNAVYWSDELFQMLGYDPDRDSASVENFFARIHPDDAPLLRSISQASTESGLLPQAECRLLRPDGSMRHVVMDGAALFDQSGKPRRLVGTVLDITESRELQQRLASVERVEAIGRLAGGIAHDFNNLLMVISNSVDLLEGDPEVLKEVRTAVESAGTLTSRLLAFGRQAPIRPRPMDLNQAVTSTLELMGRVLGEQVLLRTSLSSNLPLVDIDPHLTGQALINLLINARDAMPGGGTVTVATSRVERDGKVFAELSVEDSGPGLAQEVRAKLFEPFFTTKPEGKGTGLGLAMVHGAVAQQGGQVTLETPENGGARFVLSFPEAARLPLSSAPPKSDVVRERGSECTILIVEDDRRVAQVLSRLIALDGHRVLHADRPSTAFQLYGAHRSEIDLIISDMIMPEMTGAAMVAELAKLGPMPAVLFVSGYGAEAARDADPRYELLLKPFRPDELRTAMDRALKAAARR